MLSEVLPGGTAVVFSPGAAVVSFVAASRNITCVIINISSSVLITYVNSVLTISQLLLNYFKLACILLQH